MEVYIYISDYTGEIRFTLRKKDPTSITGWRYEEVDYPAQVTKTVYTR